jgi:hypothetical protein
LALSVIVGSADGGFVRSAGLFRSPHRRNVSPEPRAGLSVRYGPPHLDRTITDPSFVVFVFVFVFDLAQRQRSPAAALTMRAAVWCSAC